MLQTAGNIAPSSHVVPLLFPAPFLNESLQKPASRKKVIFIDDKIPVLLDFAIYMRQITDDAPLPPLTRQSNQIVWEKEPTGPYRPPNRPPDEETATHFIWRHSGGSHVVNKHELGVPHDGELIN